MVSTDSPPDLSVAGRTRPVTRVAAWLLGVALLAAFVVPERLGVASDSRVIVSELAFLAPYLLAVLASAAAARRARDAERTFWALLATSSALILALDIRYAIGHVRGIPATESSPLVVVLSAAAFAVFAGLLVTVARLRVPPGITRLRYAVDALLVGAMTFIVSLSAYVQPLFARYATIPAEDKLLAAAYPVLGMVVFGGTLTNLFGLKAERWRPWERIMVVAIATFAVALAAWPVWYLLTMREMRAADAVEAMWSVAHHLIFVAAVYRLTSDKERWDLRPAPSLRVPLGSWGTTLLLGLAAVAAGAFVHYSHVDTDGTLSPAQAEGLVIALGVLLVLRTALMAADNRALRWSVTHDPVTGLPNHRHFHELLAGEVAVAARFGEMLGVAVMDLDSFGMVNELMGHPEGDRMLLTVAKTLRRIAPEGAAVCRIGGDEFGIVIPGAGTTGTAALCEEMRQGLSRIVCPALTKVKASFGVASFPEHGIAKDELLRLADGALYWAKLHGKDRVVPYDPEVVEVLGPDDRIGLMQREHVLDTMQALAAAVDARDPGTRFHSRTVAAYAVKLAEDMGMDPDRVRLLEVAAILHDVGKIGISDTVLLKTGPLTQSERKHVQEHPLLADRILSSTTLSEIVPWVVAHHERWDGNGYPYGVTGELIPLEARILAICDAYDAMISDRPYRSALSVEAALQEIDLNIGTQFDPELAERFIRIVECERMGGWPEAAGA